MFISAGLLAQQKQVPVIKWSVAANMLAEAGSGKALGVAGPVTGITNDVLIIAGGANFPGAMPWQGGTKVYKDEILVFKLENTGKLHLLNTCDLKLKDKVAYSANVSTADGIISIGGENESGISKQVYMLQWQSNLQKVNITNLPALPLPLTNAAAATNGRMIYVAGGETIEKVSSQLFSLDLENIKAGWQRLPDVPLPVSNAVMEWLPTKGKGSLYLMGGRKKNVNSTSDFYASNYSFDIQKNEWSKKAALPYAIAAGTGISNGLLIFLFGGDKGLVFNKTEQLIAGIQGEADSLKKQVLIQKKSHLQESHRGFSNALLVYNSITDSWATLKAIPFQTPVTTTAIKWGKCVLIPSGEIRAGVRTPKVLIGKINYKAND